MNSSYIMSLSLEDIKFSLFGELIHFSHYKKSPHAASVTCFSVIFLSSLEFLIFFISKKCSRKFQFFFFFQAWTLFQPLNKHRTMASLEFHIFFINKLCSRKFHFFFFRHEHPIVPVIKEHRTMAKLLNSTLGSICSLARLSVSTQKYTIHGHWCQTSTATGRLSMEEPNLQVWVISLTCLLPFSSVNCYILC